MKNRSRWRHRECRLQTLLRTIRKQGKRKVKTLYSITRVSFSSVMCWHEGLCVLGAPTPPQEPSPQPTVVKNPEEVKRRAERKRIKQEFTAALKREGTPWALGWHCLMVPVILCCCLSLCKLYRASGCLCMWCINNKNVLCLCAEHAVKLRLELVKSHALRTVSSLQQRAEQGYRNMEEWLGARFLSEMNRWEGRRGTDGWRQIRRGWEHCLCFLDCNSFSCRDECKWLNILLKGWISEIARSYVIPETTV